MPNSRINSAKQSDMREQGMGRTVPKERYTKAGFVTMSILLTQVIKCIVSMIFFKLKKTVNNRSLSVILFLYK